MINLINAIYPFPDASYTHPHCMDGSFHLLLAQKLQNADTLSIFMIWKPFSPRVAHDVHYSLLHIPVSEMSFFSLADRAVCFDGSPAAAALASCDLIWVMNPAMLFFLLGLSEESWYEDDAMEWLSSPLVVDPLSLDNLGSSVDILAIWGLAW